jgi:hypothetical protein
MAAQGDRGGLVSASPAQTRFEESLRRERQRREAKKAGSGLKRARGPKPSRPRPIPGEHRPAAEEWHNMPWLQQCEVCHEEPARDPHHCIKEQTLRQFAYSYGYDFEVVRWDIRNRLWVGADCHERQTNASRRIHICKLPPRVFEFSHEFGFDWALEKEYDDSPIEEVA